MQNAYPLFSIKNLVVVLLLFTSVAYSQKYVVVDRENGDRLTGLLRGTTDTHVEIEYEGQVLKFPLEGNTFSFLAKLENVPDQAAAKYYRNGKEMLDLGQRESAKRLFEKALEEFPKFADAHHQLGLLHKSDGNLAKALASFGSVLLIDSENFDLAQLLQDIGDNAVAAEDYAQAVNAFQLIITHYPEHKSLSTLTYRTGFMLMEHLNDSTAALEMLQKAVEEFPNSAEQVEAVYHIGALQADTGDLEKALNTLQQFVNSYPNSEWVDDAHLKRAIIYLQMGDRKNAVNTANLVHQNSEDPVINAKADEVIRTSAWNIYTQDLPDLNIQAIAIDGTSLWIGTPKGIIQIETGGNGGWRVNEGVAWMINTSVPTVPDVRAIAADASGVWVGTRNQGIIHYNKERNENPINNYDTTNGFPSKWIRDIKMDKDEIWFATDAGVVRLNPKTKVPHHYNQENANISDDIHSIALTPETVWVGTSGTDIAIYDRESDEWKSHSFYELKPNIRIVQFDVVGNKTLFSWYNEQEETNGFFRANWDGTEAHSITLYSGSGFQEMRLFDDIFIAGVVQDGEDPEPKPLILWLATHDSVFIFLTRTKEFGGDIGYPSIIVDDLSVQCIVVDNDRAWIGTTKGMLAIEKQEVRKTVE